MKLRKYTESELINAVSNSTSMRQTLVNLNVAPFGENYDVLRKAIQHFNLDTSHFKGQAWNKGIKLPAKKALVEYLTTNSRILSYKLKIDCSRSRYLSRNVQTVVILPGLISQFRLSLIILMATIKTTD